MYYFIIFACLGTPSPETCVGPIGQPVWESRAECVIAADAFIAVTLPMYRIGFKECHREGDE